MGLGMPEALLLAVENCNFLTGGVDPAVHPADDTVLVDTTMGNLCPTRLPVGAEVSFGLVR